MTDFPDGTTGSVPDAEIALAAGWLPLVALPSLHVPDADMLAEPQEF